MLGSLTSIKRQLLLPAESYLLTNDAMDAKSKQIKSFIELTANCDSHHYRIDEQWMTTDTLTGYTYYIIACR